MSDKFLEPTKDSPKPESSAYSSIGDWVSKNCVNPFVNTLLIDSHNAAANAVNFATGKPVMGKDKLLATGEAANMLSGEFVAQQVFSGLAMIAPYTIAGKLAGGSLRSISTVSKLGRTTSDLVKAERFAAGLLNSEKTAQIVGGTIYDGLKDTHAGQTHLSNAAHAAVLFTALENINPLTRKLSWYKKYPGLLAIGAAGSALGAATGAATYDLQKEHKLNGNHILNEMSGQVVSGGVMNAFFPAAQQIAGKGIDRINMHLGRGQPIVRFAQHQDLIGKDPDFDSLLKDNPSARVQFTTDTEHKAIHKENKIILGKNWDIADAVHEGLHLESSITSKKTLNQIRDLILSDEKDEAYKQCLNFRIEQENAARRLENEVRARINENALPKSELRANAAIKTLEEFIYLENFQSEFQHFLKAPHKFSPKIDYSLLATREATNREIISAKDLAAKMRGLPNARQFKNLLDSRHVGSLPAELLACGLPEGQILSKLDQLAKVLRSLDGMLPPDKKKGLATKDLNLPELTFNLGEQEITVKKAGVGETASVYRLSTGSADFAFKIVNDPERMDIHGSYSEAGAFVYLSKFPIANLVQFHAASPSSSGGWLLNEFVTKERSRSSQNGISLEKVLDEQGFVLGDDWQPNRGPGGIIWDIGGIEPKTFNKPTNLAEFERLLNTEDGKRIACRQLDLISNQQELKTALIMGLEYPELCGQVPRTAAKYLSNPRMLNEVLSAALETKGAAGRAAFELDSLAGTAFIKGLFLKALDNPESRLEAVKHIDKLNHGDRLEAFEKAFSYPDAKAMAARFIPSLPSLREQAIARAKAISHPSSRAVQLLLSNKSQSETTKQVQEEFNTLMSPADRQPMQTEDSPGLPFSSAEKQAWLNSRIDQIIDRYTSRPISREQFEQIIESFPKADQQIAKAFIRYSAPNCSDVGLLAQLKALNFESLSEPDVIGRKLLPVYTLSATSCGNALAYLYRKVNNMDSSKNNLLEGMEIEFRNLDALKEFPEQHKIIIFDDLSSTAITNQHKQLLKTVKEIKAVDIRSFEKGVNLFDLALGSQSVKEKLSHLVAEAKSLKERLPRASTSTLVERVLTQPITDAAQSLEANVQIVKPLGWSNHPLLPKVNSHTGLNSIDSLYQWLVIPRVSHAKVKDFLSKFSDEEMPIATDMLINGQTYHSVEKTLDKLKTVHMQIGKILDHHKVAKDNLRIVVDPKEEAGGSGHLITYLYAKASKLPEENFISDNQLNELVSQGQGQGKWLAFMDDGLYSGSQMADLLSGKIEKSIDSGHGGIVQFDKILIASLGAAHSFKPNPKDHQELFQLTPTKNISALQNIWAYIALNRWSVDKSVATTPESWAELCRRTSASEKLLFTTAEPYTSYFSPQNPYLSTYFNQGSQAALRAINIATLAKTSKNSPDAFFGIDTSVSAFWGYTDTNIPFFQAFAKETLGI